MSAVTRAVRAEFSKLFSTRAWWLIAVMFLLYTGMAVGAVGAVLGADPAALGMAAAHGAPPAAWFAYSIVSTVGYAFPVILGLLSVTGEFRHNTLTPTFLAEPRRSRVLAGKVIAMFVAGAGLGLIGALVAAGVGGGLITLLGGDAALGLPETWAMFGRLVLAIALWAVVGVGIGSLVPNQIVAIVIVLAFTQFVEPLLRALGAVSEQLAAVLGYLPGAASDALVGASFFQTVSSEGTLEWWAGGLVFAAYAVVLLVLGARTSWRRDVT